MPDHRTQKRAGRVVATVAVAFVVLAGPAWGQSAAWSGSGFDAPFTSDGVTLRSDTVDVTGIFRFAKGSPTSEITGAVVGFEDDANDSYAIRDDCRIPAPVAFRSDGTDSSQTTDELTFSIRKLRLECNGRYLLRATASTNQPNESSYTMQRGVVLEVPPVPVDSISASVTDDDGTVAIQWTPLSDAETAPDALGYVLERSGPAIDGEFGEFLTIATFGTDSAGTAGDTVSDGQYRYRVRPSRDGPNGPILADAAASSTADVSYKAPPTTTSTAGGGGGGGGGGDSTGSTSGSNPQIGSAAPSQPRFRPTPTFVIPTTADTGFEETLDYTRPSGSGADDGLAGEDPFEGQAIIRDEGDGAEGADFLVPVAGALVMLGWAGHFLYLNRLAKHL